MKNERQEELEAIQKLVGYTGPTTEEQSFQTLGFVTEQGQGYFMAGLFTLLSDIEGIRKYFEIAGKYLFPISFGMKAAEWLFYLLEYLYSSNKNVDKTSTLVLKTIGLGFVGFAVFAGTLITLTTAATIFAAVTAVDGVVSFIKMIYFGIRAGLTNKPEEKQFFKDKAKENSIKTVVTLIAVAAIALTLIFAPHIVAGIIIAAAVVAAATFLTMTILGAVQRYRAYRERKKLAERTVEMEEINKPERAVQNDLNNKQILQKDPFVSTDLNASKEKPALQVLPETFKLSEHKYTGFFENSLQLVRPVATEDTATELDALQITIAKHMTTLTNDLNQANSFVETHIWSQDAKRQNKLQALRLLQEFILKFDTLGSTGTITLQNKVFHYNNLNHLILQLDADMTHRFPKVYQSFFKEVGGVEALAKQTFKLLLMKNKARRAQNDENFVSQVARVV